MRSVLPALPNKAFQRTAFWPSAFFYFIDRHAHIFPAEKSKSQYGTPRPGECAAGFPTTLLSRIHRHWLRYFRIEACSVCVAP